MLDWMSLGQHEYLILFGCYHIIIFNGYYDNIRIYDDYGPYIDDAVLYGSK